MWRPRTRVARRVANALLRAYRAGDLPEEAPRWLETTCVHAITSPQLTPGTKAQLGRLWRQYGGAAMCRGESDAVQEELTKALELAG